MKRKELNWKKKSTRNERGILKRKPKEIEDKRIMMERKLKVVKKEKKRKEQE